ncbi:expressed protein [Phakopsora pachyrhizi]|uniref:Expressed protein n=1 Tax=Phakopsora pachyrhizi TaxID=170000 RepID=A0AAV0BU98_PHAPC|nr:expressed protein [Phakopsora pachyrhizi]
MAPFASSASSNQTSSPILTTRLTPISNSHYLPPSPSPSTATITNGTQPISSLAHSALKRPRTLSPLATPNQEPKSSGSKKRAKNPNHQTITKKGTIVGQLSTQVADETDPTVKPYGCGYLSCSGANSALGDGLGNTAVRFNNCGELLAHWRAVHENDRGNIERPFVCLMEGCMRDWKNIAGIRYHIRKILNKLKKFGGIGSTPGIPQNATANGSGSKPRSSWKKKPANNPKNEEKEAARKYKCPVPGCDKSYQQTSGLKYHLSNAPEHIQEIQRDKINLDALIAQSTLNMLKNREENPGPGGGESKTTQSSALPPTPVTTADTSTSASATAYIEQPGQYNNNQQASAPTSNLAGMVTGDPHSMMTHPSIHHHHPSFSHAHFHQHQRRNPHEVFMMANSITTSGHTNGSGFRFN